VKNNILAKLATQEDDATTQGSQDDELKNAFCTYLETKTAKGKELEKLTTPKDNTLRQSSMTAEKQASNNMSLHHMVHLPASQILCLKSMDVSKPLTKV
jgi:hypothetical protein